MTPSDNTTLVEVIEGYRTSGFDSDARDPGALAPDASPADENTVST